MKNNYYFLLTLLLFFNFSIAQNSEATYTITYTSTWSETTHPHPTGNFPPGAHYSKLVGATHNDMVVFLEMGGFATQGIENIAELGDNAVFFSEVNTAIGNGTASLLIDGDALNTSTGEIVIQNVVTTEDHSLLTMVSMIAPSPDWMVALNSFDLLDANGDWKDGISIDLFPYDAGTDSGTDYSSPNMNTDPQEPISSLQGVPPFSNEKMGTISITLENVVLGLDDPSQNEVRMYPNPASEVLNITSGDPDFTVEIFNVLGERIRSVRSDATEFRMDISELTSGIYMVRISSSGSASSVKKLIKR